MLCGRPVLLLLLSSTVTLGRIWLDTSWGEIRIAREKEQKRRTLERYRALPRQKKNRRYRTLHALARVFGGGGGFGDRVTLWTFSRCFGFGIYTSSISSSIIINVIIIINITTTQQSSDSRFWRDVSDEGWMFVRV